MDAGTVLDALAAEMQLNHPQAVTLCGGCGAKLVRVTHDDLGREVKDYACGHRFRVGGRSVVIERW